MPSGTTACSTGEVGGVSAENVELIRALAPGPDDDLPSLLNDDRAAAQWIDAIAEHFHPSVQGTMRFAGMTPVTYEGGMEGLLEAWRDWLRYWASFRTEVEDVLDAGDRVVLVFRGYGRRRPDAPEITLRRAAIWTVTGKRVSHVDFNVPHEEALAAVRPTT